MYDNKYFKKNNFLKPAFLLIDDIRFMYES